MKLDFVFAILLPVFRRPRMRRFMETMQPLPGTRILDVGGTPYNWKLVAAKSRITLLNLAASFGKQRLPPNFAFLKGDGTELPFSDGAFDIVFSNSVIEHLGTFEKQQAFAAELSRVGKRLWVQTPAKAFFIEPHLLTPLLHYLPKRWQRCLLRNFSVWGLATRPSAAKVDRFLAEVRLLSYREMMKLMPDCNITVDRFLFWPKAYVAVRR